MSWLFGLGISMSWFSSLGISIRGFLSSEKMPWNHDVVTYLSPFLDVVVFKSPNLDVVVFWSWNPDVVLYVSPRPRFRYHCENITHNYVNHVVEKFCNCPNLCKSIYIMYA